MGTVLLMLAVSTVAMGLYVFFVERLWVLPLLERMTPNILYRVKTKEPLVALSFDDGPHPEFTLQVLEILEQHDAKATFFVIGERAQRNPELVQRIRAAGHEIGNHYWKDGTTLGHSDSKFVEKLEETDRTIQQVAASEGPLQKAGPTTNQEEDPGSKGEPGAPTDDAGKAASGRRIPKFFRAPGGVAWPRQLRLARERGYACVLGCAYPHDPMRPPVKYIRWLIEKNLAPGTIVILHDGIADATRSIEALPHILEEGKRRGLRFVSIGELVEAGEMRTASE